MQTIEDELTDDYTAEHGPEGLTYRAKQLIKTLASMIEDEEKLEAVCKEHGSSYSTTGDKGQEVHKHRPEHVELMKVRQMKLQYVKQLGLGVGKEVTTW
jgi:hypothetical protein